jgi:hypothetical protein
MALLVICKRCAASGGELDARNQKCNFELCWSLNLLGVPGLLALHFSYYLCKDPCDQVMDIKKWRSKGQYKG